MDFAIFIGGERTVIYKAGQGIVLNELSLVAKKDGKIIACGNDCERYKDSLDTTIHEVIRFGCVHDVGDASVFLASCVRKLRVLARFIVCIPSSLALDALDDYKTAIYTAGVADAEFIPCTIASLFVTDYDISMDAKVLSIVVVGGYADMNVIQRGEIIDGGTLFDLTDFEDAKRSLLNKHQVVKVHHGERITIINGAGNLLKKKDLIKRIVKLN
ncbi:MAG: rod shape-determining protein [Firmicutes bacterium]|nr:rod shape-determining protein [Bacillota bacterium]